MPAIYSYQRVSSSKQQHGTSLELQKNDEILAKLSTEHHLPISDLSFKDIASAYKGHHLEGELGQFIEAVKSGQIKKGSILVVYSLDRLSRQSLGIAKQTYLDLTNNGCSIFSILDNKLYQAHTAADDILATIIFERAQNESATKAARTNAKALKVISDHLNGVRTNDGYAYLCAFGRLPWWIAVRDDKAVIKCPTNWPIALEVISLIKKGYGINRLMDHLNDKYPHRKWKHGALAAFHTQEALYGLKTVSCEGQEYKLVDYYPALISKAEYYALANIKKMRVSKRKAQIVGLISGIGIGRCAHCGSPIGSQLDHTSETPTLRYFCQSRTKKDKKCPLWTCKAAHIENILFNECRSVIYSAHPEATSDSLDALIGQRNELDMKLGALKEAIKQDARLAVMFAGQLSEILDQLDIINNDIDTEQQKLALGIQHEFTMQAFKDWVNMSSDALNESNTELRNNTRDIIKLVFNRIEIGKYNGRIFVIFTTADNKQRAAVLTGTQRAQKYLPLTIVSEQDVISINENMPELAHLYCTKTQIHQHVLTIKNDYGHKTL